MEENIETGVKVGDIMTRNFIFAKPDILVLNAVKLMVKHKIGSLLITEKGLLKGILTEKDILWALNKKNDLSDTRAIDICTKKITTIRPSADVYQAMKVMKKAKFRRLPVTVNKRVIGYLTLKELLKIQPELFEIVHEGQSIREHKEKLKRKQEKIDFTEGVCEVCGNLDMLYDDDERLICESCKNEQIIKNSGNEDEIEDYAA